MTLDILTPEKQLFSGEVDSVTLPGSKGTFQVLNKHASLVSSLQKGKLKYKSGGQTSTFTIESGFVEVHQNKVVVLVEGVSEAV